MGSARLGPYAGGPAYIARQLEAELLDPRELRLREEGLAERARPGEQLRHGVPPPNVRTRKEAAVEMFRVLGQTLDDLGG